MTIALTIRFDNATQAGGLMPDPPSFSTDTSSLN
jgi:hypothetical protein